MARVNVDDELFFDPRFKALARRLGNEDTATGMCIRLWRLAQKYWGKDHSPIPYDVFCLEDLEVMLEVGMAIKTEMGVYVKGSQERFDWYRQKVEAGKKGGKRSTEVRQQAKSKHPLEGRLEKSKHPLEKPEAKMNPPALVLAPVLDNKTPVVPFERGRRKNLNNEAARLVARVTLAATQQNSVEDDARRTAGEEAWVLLRKKYPNWPTFIKFYRDAIQNKKANLFELDLKNMFKAFLEEKHHGTTQVGSEGNKADVLHSSV